MDNIYNIKIDNLGPAHFHSPFSLPGIDFIDDNERVFIPALQQEVETYIQAGKAVPSLERGGPRLKMFFKPGETIACIVTCGGLCPGINDVIRSIVLTLYNSYGVHRILGARYGFEGLIESFGHGFLELNPQVVKGINERGGSILASSRGYQDVGETVDTLVKHKINILFTIGGDGTQRGAHDLVQEIKKRGLKIAVVGIPKTIDNDVLYVDQTFGFVSAVHACRINILAAHEEAQGVKNGIGIVKLMGRDSGFIAAHASVANSVVNFCLIPELPFELDGEGGLLQKLEQRLKMKSHAVIVVAEGAGQHLMPPQPKEKDASGNIKHHDIGIFLKNEIDRHFKIKNIPVNIRYIDPSYTIRVIPTGSVDSILCTEFGMMAVHAAMAGKTDMIIGRRNNYAVHVPIPLAVAARRKMDFQSSVFQTLISSTIPVAIRQF